MAYRVKYFLPAILYVLLIITLSSLNQNVVAQYSMGIQDFILHASEYHLFGLTIIWAVLRDKPWKELKPSYRIAVGVGALFAFADEFYQSFVPTRFSTMDDVVADVFGVILSIITFSLLMKIPILERFRQNA